MGSWSVYCSISKIAITSGQECVFLPLRKVKHNSSYLPYIPATLPIFGSYDDYGGIEDIVEDENTKWIEKHFNCTIHDFCYFFTRGMIRLDEDDFPKHLNDVEEIKEWKFMWIDRKVYDFMSTHKDSGFGGAGDHDYGKPKMLEYLGFNFIGESEKNNTYDPKRFTQIWEKDGVIFNSDGSWLQCGKEGIHRLTGNWAAITQFVSIPEDKMDIANKYKWELWKIADEDDYNDLLFWILGVDRYSSSRYSRIFGNGTDKAPTTLVGGYTKDVNLFGDRMAELVTIRHNLHCMSGYFEPFVKHLTPQCGEYKSHQVILEKFAEINKSIITENGYDEDEEE
jgi:hypothetical protein